MNCVYEHVDPLPYHWITPLAGSQGYCVQYQSLVSVIGACNTYASLPANLRKDSGGFVMTCKKGNNTSKPTILNGPGESIIP